MSSGGFGCTYDAEHIMLHKRVAIKEFFVKDFCNRDGDTHHVTVATQSKVALADKLRRKFIDEAGAISQLHHPNIVSVSDVFEENGTAYYVMDYIDGQSLGEVLKAKGRLSEAKALHYIRQICEALRYVHSKNRLHLDIKPGNIMIDAQDNALLIDFGASKQYDEENGENTSSIVGRTPGYAPLEQTGNTLQNFTPATDIYALGATLYKLLTGVTPPEVNVLLNDDAALQPLPSNVSATTRNAIAQAMQIKRKDRPQDISAFLQLLAAQPVAAEVKKPAAEEDEVQATIAENAIIKLQAKQDVDQSDLDDFLREKETKSYLRFGIKPQTDEEILSEYLTTEDSEDTPKNLFTKKKLAYVVLPILVVLIIIMFFSGSKNDGYDGVVEVINDHEAIDLGLSVKWATCNVGASSPEDIGERFAWGEVSPSDIYLPYAIDIEYDDITGTEYDAATQLWGSDWRMPTKEEMEELKNNCSWTRTCLNNIDGYFITGPNGNRIFLPNDLPMAESVDETVDETVNENMSSTLFGYWSSTGDETLSYAFGLMYDSSDLISLTCWLN